MNRHARAAAFLGLAGLLILPAGAAPAAKPTPSGAPGGLGVGSDKVSFYLPDPKNPRVPQLKLWAKGATGQSVAGGSQGTLTGVSAIFFQEGKPATAMRAPQVHGFNLANPVVVATGGVRITSLTHPGAYLTSDQATWYPKQNKIVAVGHVVYHAGGKSAGTLNAKRATFDTRLETLSI